MFGFLKKPPSSAGSRVPDGTFTNLGKGYDLLTPEKMLTLNIPDAHRKGHLWCFGTTRVGKSRLIEHIAEQDIRKGYSTLIIDPKGDHGLFSKVVQIAEETHREEDLILVTPIFPRYSAIINPLSSYYMKEELVAHICAGVAVGKEPFFANVAYQVSMLVTEALMLISATLGKPWNYNLNDIKKNISHSAIKELRDEIDRIETSEAQDLVVDLNKILENPPDYFSKIANSLDVALTELTRGNVGKIIGQADSNRFIERLENGDRIIMVVQLSSLLTKKAAYTAGKVIISMLQAYVGRVLAKGGTMANPLSLLVDEAQSIIYQGIEDLFAKGGSANLYISGFSQSVNQLYSEIQENRARSILDNCNTKIFLRAPDADTAEYISLHLGEQQKYSPMMSLGGGLTIREIDEERIKPAEILQLKNREFFLTTYTGIYRGKTAEVYPAEVEIDFPATSNNVTSEDNVKLPWGTDYDDFILTQKRIRFGGSTKSPA